ncbi:hypothetical protein BU23DRAFT_235565 [Bimuria novae-zelandiae CBS 107.79]|uniref:Uncharacterized protein n=1 Tax=Bimuria novae-zelandiae CBS 107.79 TaxID=1447943 RepID=A0A6A5UY47_9PLEO|nr:hypothetical protein BU23DRAFT_235565 [Bimuria novae-zelandiae CBS 107.79]
MIQSPVSPESPRGDVKDGARTGAFTRIHNYEPGLEVAAHQDREKSDLDPVVVLGAPDAHIYRNQRPWNEAPQVIDTMAPQAMGDAPLEPNSAVSSETAHHRDGDRDADAADAEKCTEAPEEKKEAKRWCGVSTKVFLLIVALVLLLVGAVIGGAVGGTQARKSALAKGDNQTSPSQSSSSENATSPTKTISSSATATQSPHVRFRLQTYENKNFEGSSQLFTEPGLYKPAFDIMSYIWVSSRDGDLQDPTPLLRCSVAFCLNDTTNGWRGSSDMRQTGEGTSYKSDTNFVHISCDLVWVEPACRDLGLDQPAASKTVATVPIWETPFNPTPTKSDSSSGSNATPTSGSESGSASSRTTQRSSTRTSSTLVSETASRTQTG